MGSGLLCLYFRDLVVAFRSNGVELSTSQTTRGSMSHEESSFWDWDSGPMTETPMLSPFPARYRSLTRIKSSRLTSRRRRRCSKNVSSEIPERKGPRPRTPGRTGASTAWKIPSLASVMSRSPKFPGFEIQSVDCSNALKVESKLGSR